MIWLTTFLCCIPAVGVDWRVELPTEQPLPEEMKGVPFAASIAVQIMPPSQPSFLCMLGKMAARACTIALELCGQPHHLARKQKKISCNRYRRHFNFAPCPYFFFVPFLYWQLGVSRQFADVNAGSRLFCSTKTKQIRHSENYIEPYCIQLYSIKMNGCRTANTSRLIALFSVYFKLKVFFLQSCTISSTLAFFHRRLAY